MKMLVLLLVTYVATLTGVIITGVTHAAPVDHVTGPSMIVMGLIAVGYGVRVARHPALDPAVRRAWRLVTAALALAVATPLVFLLVTGARPFPQPGDATHLASTLTLFVAMLLFPLHSATRRDRWKAVMDSATVVIGASMVLWYLVVGPAIVNNNHGSARVILAAAAYPVSDLLALFGFARVLLRGTDRKVRRPLWLLAGAILFLFAGDAFLGWSQAHEATVQRTPWQFACWLTFHFLLTAGAVEQFRQAGRPAAGNEQPRDVAGKIPYAGIGVGYGLMAVAAVHQAHAYPWLGLVIGSIGITGLVVFRQMLAQRESDEAAATDTLTGLANRARLHLVLARALERGARTQRRTAVLLIDLNGFKQINDTLGHQTGDGLLIAVAEAMRRCVRGDDLIGRLGGDEFAVVLPALEPAFAVEDSPVTVARRITEALTHPLIVDGTTLRASASIGVAIAEPGALTSDELLHQADGAMYRAKRESLGFALSS